VVDGAQRLEPSRGSRNNAIFLGGLGHPKQAFKEIWGKTGHIAGDDQVPVALGGSQRGLEPAHGSAIGRRIGDQREPEHSVAFGGSYQSDVTGSLRDDLGNLLDQRSTVGGKQGFVPSHTATLASGEDPAGSGCSDYAPHEKMLTSLLSISGVTYRNKKVYICFILALAASPMRASEPSPATPAASARIAYVVRADRRTGKLVRTAVVAGAPPAAKSKAPQGISTLVDQAAKTNHVDPLLVHSVIQVESNYNQYAVSRVGAEGLMQLMPGTAKMLGVTNSFDAKENIEAGVRYLKSLQDQFKDDRLALAAYNAGPSAVEKYKWVPPYEETQKYVREVGRRYEEAKTEAAQKPAPKPPEPEAVMTSVAPSGTQDERHPKLEQFVDQDGRLHLKTAD
jgi:Transglycosylase SLT domain